MLLFQGLARKLVEPKSSGSEHAGGSRALRMDHQAGVSLVDRGPHRTGLSVGGAISGSVVGLRTMPGSSWPAARTDRPAC